MRIMRPASSCKLAFVSLLPLLLAAFCVLADDIPTEPTITVVGQRQGGGVITCTTGACLDSGQEEALQSFLEWLEMYDSYPQEDVPLNGERFCQSLASKQPQAAV